MLQFTIESNENKFKQFKKLENFTKSVFNMKLCDCDI